MRRKSRNKGLTLTELLVVLAIVGLLGLITVPSFVRFYLDSTDRVKLTSRELLQILQTARMYAMTYRVNTAVIYSVDVLPVETNVLMPNGEPGVVTKGAFRAIKTAAVMYEISRKNNEYFDGIKRRLGIPDVVPWDSFYVPVGSTRLDLGSSREFPQGVVMCGYGEMNLDGNSIPTIFGINEGDAFSMMGLSMVYVPLLYLEGRPHAEEKYVDLLDRGELNDYTLWYAHIFSPSGKLLQSDAVKERYTFAVVDVTNREPLLVRKRTGVEGEPSYFEDIRLVEYKKSMIELYRSSGMAKIIR